MLEKEAKSRWCPMAKTSASDEADCPASVNRENDGSITRETRCLTRECMWWRWTRPIEKEGYCGAIPAPESF